MPALEAPLSLGVSSLWFHRLKDPIGPFGTQRWALVAIIVLSLTLRLASALYQGLTDEVLPGVHDQVTYDALARRVLEGHGFTFAVDWWPATAAGQPTAHWSYAYTLYLVLVYTLFGPYPLAARLIQATVAGVLHPWLTWRLGSGLFGSRVGLIASLIAAFYGYFVFYAGALMTETFYILAILWGLGLAIRARTQERIQPRTFWLALGVALGTAVLLRQVFLLFVPFLFLWLLTGPSRGNKGLSGAKPVLAGILTAMAAAAVLILPWTMHNYSAFGRFVLLNSNAGFVFFWSNHPIHGSRFVPVLPEDGPSYHDLIPAPLLALDEARLDQALLMEGLRQVADDPGRYLRLSASRAVEYFKFWPSANSSLPSNIIRTLSFGLLLPVALLGICVSIVGFRGPELMNQHQDGTPPAHPAGRNLLYLFILAYTVIHLLSWALIRYRLPIDAVLVIFAAVGILWLRQRCTGMQQHIPCAFSSDRDEQSATSARPVA